jgi:uncharacterized membrane protein
VWLCQAAGDCLKAPHQQVSGAAAAVANLLQLLLVLPHLLHALPVQLLLLLQDVAGCGDELLRQLLLLLLPSHCSSCRQLQPHTH